MRLCLLPMLLLLFCSRPAAAQVPLHLTSPPADSSIQIKPSERQFFALGVALSRGAFAYAELAKLATAVSRTRSKIAQVGQLGRLAPTARRNRLSAQEGLGEAMALMQLLNAPAAAQAAVRREADRLAGPLPMTADARPVAFFSSSAALTLSSLSEFNRLSSLPEDTALRRWLESPAVADSAQVWYGEGEIAALAQIAAAQQMPELLPPAEQIATDLRGLRDWLSLRMPDLPTSEQTSLEDALNSILREIGRQATPGQASRKPLSTAQLHALGEISRQLQVQILGPNTDAMKTALCP